MIYHVVDGINVIAVDHANGTTWAYVAGKWVALHAVSFVPDLPGAPWPTLPCALKEMTQPLPVTTKQTLVPGFTLKELKSMLKTVNAACRLFKQQVSAEIELSENAFRFKHRPLRKGTNDKLIVTESYDTISTTSTEEFERLIFDYMDDIGNAVHGLHADTRTLFESVLEALQTFSDDTRRLAPKTKS